MNEVIEIAEAEKVRDIKVIQQEYTQKCMQAGDLQYKIICMKNDLDGLNELIRGLNQEAANLAKPDQPEKSAE